MNVVPMTRNTIVLMIIVELPIIPMAAKRDVQYAFSLVIHALFVTPVPTTLTVAGAALVPQ
jgi:hypothetical protein